MRSFSTVDLLRDLKTVAHAATREPVAITQHRRPRFVLMAIEDYEKLADRADPRRAFKAEEMPDDILAIFRPALEAALRDEPANGE